MGLRSIATAVEKLERRHRPRGHPIVAQLPGGARYTLVGKRILIPPRKRKGGELIVDWWRSLPGAWRRYRPSDGPIDRRRVLEVPDLAVFTKCLPMGGGPTLDLRNIDISEINDDDRAKPIARSRD